MKDKKLVEGIYGLLINTNNKIEKLSEHLVKTREIPKTFEEFEELDNTYEMIESLCRELSISEELSKLYQAKRTAISIIVDKNLDAEEKVEIDYINEILRKADEELNEDNSSIKKALE